MSLHDIKVGVWCALSATRIFGPILFLDRINSEGYSRQALTHFILNLSDDDENKYRFFQENSATAHTANNSITILHNISRN
jgi:hypothetical protein